MNTERFTKDVELAIRLMGPNKSIGTDGVHVDMLKENPGAVARKLTAMW